MKDLQMEETENNIEFSIRACTLAEEVDYVWYCVNRMEFFNKFGYNLSLPQTEEINLLVNKSLQNQLVDADISILQMELSKVYDSEFYQNKVNELKEASKSINETFNVFKHYNTLWGFKLFEHYVVKVTQFGPGGSYDSNNGEILRKMTKYSKSVSNIKHYEIIVHEITHIGIEKLIVQKYNIPHNVKERIVDMFMIHHFKEIFPSCALQGRGDTSVDEYLTHMDSWERLPYYIEKFANEKLQR